MTWLEEALAIQLALRAASSALQLYTVYSPSFAEAAAARKPEIAMSAGRIAAT